MCWFNRVMLKVSVFIVTTLLIFLFLNLIMLVSAEAQIIAKKGHAMVKGAVTMQATPIEDATVTALNKEKLVQEVNQLDNQNNWIWNFGATLLSTLALAVAGIFAIVRYFNDRQDERERRDEEQQRWLKNQEFEREKRDEERFRSIVEGLGGESAAARVGAAIVLRTFLQPGYEQFYRQAFDLSVVHLRLRNINPVTPEPVDSLSQALIVAFREVFPLARDNLKKQMSQFIPQLLDATGIQLDNAYLSQTDLSEIRMRKASLRDAHFWKADLKGSYLKWSDLKGAYLVEANLSQADLGHTDLTDANLTGANLSFAHILEADLTRANFTRANLTGLHPERAKSLEGTLLLHTIGLTQAQRDICKTKGAIIDENSTEASLQSAGEGLPQSVNNDIADQPIASVQNGPSSTDEEINS